MLFFILFLCTNCLCLQKNGTFFVFIYFYTCQLCSVYFKCFGLYRMVSSEDISSVAKKKKRFFLFFVNDDGQNNNMFIRNAIFFPQTIYVRLLFFRPDSNNLYRRLFKKKDTKRFSAFSSPEKVNETITIVRLNRIGSLVTWIFFLIRLPTHSMISFDV